MSGSYYKYPGLVRVTVFVALCLVAYFAVVGLVVTFKAIVSVF